MIHKKHTSLPSAKTRTDSSNYGKIDTFENIYRLLYLHLFLSLSTVNHHFSWSSSFICIRNENSFMKRNQRDSHCWTTRHFCQGCNRKFYKPVRSVTEMLSTCLLFAKGKKYIKLMLGTLFSGWRYSNTICREKCSAWNDIQTPPPKTAFFNKTCMHFNMENTWLEGKNKRNIK
jgi:hypothetical protein